MNENGLNESDLNHHSELEQAKQKLQEVQEQKEARKNPRADEAPRPLPATQPPAKDGENAIRPVQTKPKKKRFSQKLKEAMFSEDIGNGSVTEYVFFKILVPSVKRVLSDMANTAINMALGLDPRTRTVGTGNTHVANASVYRDRNYSRPEPDVNYRRRDAVSEYEWDEDTAWDIYRQIEYQIENYDHECSLANVYAIMNMGDKIRSTDRNWGWTSMNGINVVCVYHHTDPKLCRYIVDMPSAKPLR